MAKIDFSISEDGDLIPGAPKVDPEDNKILYYYPDTDTVGKDNFRGSVEGKMICDMAYTTGRMAIKQIIMNRLKTDAPDWYHHPQMGGNLSDLIGEPNTSNTGNLGAQYIAGALTYGRMFAPEQIYVKATPISAEEIMFFITINIDDREPYRLPIVFNLNYGLKEA
jgi:hypothetical protein